ncbi:hypothetical protein [Bacillus sp. NEB1478]|uniref:hypothetical protein n=1 Tax=Bacillus sp. NEB1478 TaxID=3073816 RepID=UPI00287340DC|nr:hypothetical protein [Bacillus sp. NEB1478]WNB93410.1 hypothetical protein RGB74_07000 [Bacillus sp. NEB1478]
MGDILRTNELDNAIDYLEKAAFYFNNRVDNYWFKWMIISLHGALYGFGVCAIKGTSTERVLEMKLGKKKLEQKKKEIIDFYKYELGFDVEQGSNLLDSTVEYNSSQLLSIKTILEHCQNESYMMQQFDSKILKISEPQQNAIDKMILYRNDFAHFKPKALSVITQGEDWIVKEVVDVIKFLALDSGNVTYFEDSIFEKVKYLINRFK